MKTWYAVASLVVAGTFAVACADSPTAVSKKDLQSPRILASVVTGAAFTTTNPTGTDLGGTGGTADGTGHCKNGNETVNCNIYDGKKYVWLNGGPASAQIGGAGDYFFAVLVPSGQGSNDNPNDGTLNNLSDVSPTSGTGAGDAWTNRKFTVDANGIITNYTGTHDYANGKIRLMPYDNTTNPGGVYIMAVCRVPSSIAAINPPGVVPSDCKYDAFKVREGDIVTQYGTVTVDKFYDANANGVRDAGEVGIAGWAMTLNPGAWTLFSPASFTTLDAGTYSVTEGVPGGAGEAARWFITYKGGSAGGASDNLLTSAIRLSTATVTDRTIPGIAVVAGGSESRLFGNVCIGATAGWTRGFWSNSNGKTALQAGLGTGGFNIGPNYSLRDNLGVVVNPFSGYTPFKNWIGGANSGSNQSYQLSAQLAASWLNVNVGVGGTKASSATSIFAPGTTSAGAGLFATLGAVMTESATFVSTYSTVPPGASERTRGSALIAALDGANNNVSYVQPSPCTFSFAF